MRTSVTLLLLLLVAVPATAVQYLRPDGDISSNGACTYTRTPASANFYDRVDEVTIDTGDYYENGSTTSGNFCTVETSLSNPASAPTVDTGHTLRIGWACATNAFVYLYQGATQIHSEQISGCDSATGNSISIPSGSAALITNYDDLRVRTHQGVDGGDAPLEETLTVYWIELEVPDATTRRVFVIN